MIRSDDKSLPNLGVFALGVSYLLYSFMQYFFAPICWWLAQQIESLYWMNDVFVLFETLGVDVFTGQSIGYSLLGLGAFFCAYLFVPAKLARIKSVTLSQTWNVRRAEIIFWLLFLTGFAIKTVKVLGGLDVPDAVESYIRHSLISSPFVVFFLSFNWFHMVALMVINIAYRESKRANHFALKRLRVIAYATTCFVLVVSLTTGSRTATLFPLLSLLIIRQYYVSRHMSLLKFVWITALLVVLIFFLKYFISEIVLPDESGVPENSGFRYVLAYILFFRVNMSEIVAGVLEKGQQVFPEGTLGQFWVDMGLYGTQRTNVLDGNEFGHAMGMLSPDDFVTGIAATNMGDLYINGGVAGILIGMFMTGILYKIFYANCQRHRPMFIMLYALMWPILLHGMESPITVLYSTAIKMILLCLIVHFAITIRFSARSQWSGFSASLISPPSIVSRGSSHNPG